MSRPTKISCVPVTLHLKSGVFLRQVHLVKVDVTIMRCNLKQPLKQERERERETFIYFYFYRSNLVGHWKCSWFLNQVPFFKLLFLPESTFV